MVQIHNDAVALSAARELVEQYNVKFFYVERLLTLPSRSRLPEFLLIITSGSSVLC